jgi:hypothetical protein
MNFLDKILGKKEEHTDDYFCLCCMKTHKKGDDNYEQHYTAYKFTKRPVSEMNPKEADEDRMF